VVHHAEWLRGRRFWEWLRPQDKDKYRLFGDHTPEQRAAVKASASKTGIQVPTIRDEYGNLLDGFLRNEVAANLRIPCPTEVRQFNSEAEKCEFILTVNCQRRQLNQDQKRRLIAAYLIRDPEINDNWLAEIIGGVSKNTVAVERRHLEKTGQIASFQKLRGKDGKTRPARFKKIIANTTREMEKAIEIINDLPPNCAGKTVDLTTAKRRARRHKKKEEREIRIIEPLPDDAIRLYHCRFQELEQVAGIQPASVNLVLTDIPYGAEFLPELDDLGAFAQRVLADSGLFVTYYGHAYLDRVMKTLDKYLTYRWMLASTWEDGGGNLYFPLQLVSRWKPILLYSKGDWNERDKWYDVLRGNSKEKNHHEWQQSLIESEWLLRYFSNRGDLVVDPCGGGFTTGVACWRRDRRFIGCDVEAECVSKGQERLQQEKQAGGDAQA
jgi:site-specific DNA-methyltransferase (adenine-specific)